MTCKGAAVLKVSALLPLLLLMLTACETLPKIYVQPPQDSELFSEIELVNISRFGLYALLYEEPLTCSGQIVLERGFKGLFQNDRRTIRVKKGSPVAIGAYYLTQTPVVRTQCDLNATFVPRADAYRIVYSTDEELKRCFIRAVEKVAGAWSNFDPASLNLRRYHQAFSQPGPWCEPLSERQRASLGLSQ
jgi:hypothetical protein